MADFELSSRDDFQKMVNAQIEETLTLEYKASPALTRDSKNVTELCKDASAMANSAGGQIIYGIEEDKKTHKPSKVDDGVTDEKITREWIQQTLSSNIHPRMDGIKINRVELSAKGYGYVISIDPTQNGPHQAPDKKYYKRFELQSAPMEDYEVRDIFRRAITPDLSIQLSFDNGETFRAAFDANDEYSHTFYLNCLVVNKSASPANYAIVEVMIDNALNVPRPPESFQHVRSLKNFRNSTLKVFQRTISSPPGVPVFKEAVHESHRARIPLRLSAKNVRSSIIYLETNISAPGVSKREEQAIFVTGGLMKLIPPNSPFLK